MANQDDTIELPAIEANDNDIAATYESALVFLFLSQDKFKTDADPVAFIENGTEDIASYFNLKRMWDSSHLGDFPTLEVVCASYHMGPNFIDRLNWYAAGAQIQPNAWNISDPDYREPEDDESFDNQSGTAALADAQPAISTGEERVGPEDEIPWTPSPAPEPADDNGWTASGWASELEQQAEDEFGVDDKGNVFNKQTGEVVSQGDLEPPSWMGATWGGEPAQRDIGGGSAADEPTQPASTAAGQTLTLLVGFQDDVTPPSTPCEKAVWDAHVATLKKRYQDLLDAKEQMLKAVSPQIEYWRETWKSARDNKTWKA